MTGKQKVERKEKIGNSIYQKLFYILLSRRLGEYGRNKHNNNYINFGDSEVE